MSKNKPKDIDWDSVNLTNYRSKILSPAGWHWSANDLLKSAELLKPVVEKCWESWRSYHKDKSDKPESFIPVAQYFMLVAYAMENYFKAKIVGMNYYEFDTHIKTKKSLPGLLKNHDLVELAKSAEYNIQEGEEDLLRRMTRYSMWGGRYPIPIYYKKFENSEKFDDGKTYSVAYFSGNDLNNLEQLTKNIKSWLKLDCS